jgi:3-hydroxybutyrate dehydrogenase
MSGLPRSSHALVTGGGRGIGREIASSLVQAGATVTVLGRNRKALDDLVAAGVAHAAVIADVADQAAMNSALAEAALRQPIDILVANAGIAESAPFGKTDAVMFRRMLDVNFMGVVYAAQAVLRPMVQRRQGRIVAIASTAGLKGYSYVSAYCAAKHAVVGLVRSLALEVATSGVTVLVAGSIDNIMSKTGRSRDEAIAELAKHNPQGKLVTPAEVANAVVWLCSPGASSVTGQTIAVAGGEI